MRDTVYFTLPEAQDLAQDMDLADSKVEHIYRKSQFHFCGIFFAFFQITRNFVENQVVRWT